MPNWPYTRNIPAGGNNPSADRPLMTENYNSNDSLIAEDHISFNSENGGFHKQIRMPTMANMPNPLIRIPSSITEYSKVSGQSQLFITNGQSTNEYQLTLMDNTNAPTFGVFPAFTYTSGQTGSAGWTFLPGGIRMQYGVLKLNSSNLGVIINYPIAFTQLFNVQCTYIGGSTNIKSWQIQGTSTTEFGFIRSGSNSTDICYVTWMALGI